MNKTDCDLVADSFGCRNSNLSCARRTAKCGLPILLREGDTELAKIKAAFQKTPPRGRDVRLMKAIDRIIAAGDWNDAKGQKNCWPLGDSIIALECPRDAHIYTKDRHFDVICQAIGKKLYQETSF